MKERISQPMYNMLIEPLEKIQNSVKNGIEHDNLICMANLSFKLEQRDYSPFEYYQEMITRLNFENEVFRLYSLIKIYEKAKQSILRDESNDECEYLQELKNHVIECKNLIIGKLEKLISYGHVLNMMDCHFNTVEAENKKVLKMLLENRDKLGTVIPELEQFGMLFKQSQSCHGQKQYDSLNTLAEDTTPAKEYLSILKILNLNVSEAEAKANQKLQNFCATVFTNFNEKVDLALDSEENLFNKALLTAFEKIAKNYRSDFLNQSPEVVLKPVF